MELDLTNSFAHRLVRRMKTALIALIAVVLLVGWLSHEGWLPESGRRLITFDEALKIGIILGMLGSALTTVVAASIAIRQKQREAEAARRRF